MRDSTANIIECIMVQLLSKFFIVEHLIERKNKSQL